MPTAFVHHRDCTLHDMGSHHPECPARIAAIEDHLLATGIVEHLVDVDAPSATREQLQRVHHPDYVDAIEASVPARGLVHLDPDTAMNPHSYHAALRAAGAVVKATDMVMSGVVENAFCNVRPPGHHAERARAMGFCFFNNVAVGVAHALEKYGLERVAVVDFDVHHGNGTEDIFRHDHRVMMVSTFQHPFYPYSGAEGRSERMVNIPLAAHSGGVQFREAVEQFWIPALERFQPQMIFVSAGFDAHRDDDMASLSLVEADYAWVTERLVKIADGLSGGRIVSTLEGGYDLNALARSVVVHLRALARL
ncbi:MAG TPA: histone deacetylase family protein [Burkholderiales bacterium]|jgi:acetoin utilization deacetylase AcuC-like enzyme|nr:histone deacetylase family protein [Burkholderiales bacterium]